MYPVEAETLITTYQVRNVLRVYGNHLIKSKTPLEDITGPMSQTLDLVDISIEARRKQMLTQMSNKLISQITPKSEQKNAEGQNLRNGNLSEPNPDGI